MHNNCATMIAAQEGCWQDNCFSAAVFFGAWIVGSRSFCQSFQKGWKDCLTKRTWWNNIPHPISRRFQHAVPSSFFGGKEHQPHFWIPFLHLRPLNYQYKSTDHSTVQPGSHTDKFNCDSMDHCSTVCSQALTEGHLHHLGAPLGKGIVPCQPCNSMQICGCFRWRGLNMLHHAAPFRHHDCFFVVAAVVAMSHHDSCCYIHV